MSETPTAATELTTQYSARVADDLERNLKEQERLGDEIEALQAQLAALRRDNTVLVNLQQALGISGAPAAEPVATAPAPRTKAKAGAKAAGKRKQAAKSAAPARRRTGRKASPKTPATATSSTAPTLVDLVREHLAGQSEPRSATEITTALGQQHPERAIKTTVVRTTLEGLVAKSRAQRTKQGASVFYTAPQATPPAARQEPARQGPA